MVILEEVPKLPTDPSVGPTNREDLRPDPTTPASSSRPPSPNPTLPDYETSQEQQSSNRKPWRGRRFWHSRIGKLVSYALVVYSSVVFIIGVPAFVLRSKSFHKSKFKWEADGAFADHGPPHPPPPLPPGSQADLSPQGPGNTSFSCNNWIVPTSRPGEPPTTTAGDAELMLPFPLLEGIALRLNSSAHESNSYISGNFTVDMNPEKNVSNVVLLATARYTSFQLIKASSVCFAQFRNTTEIMIHIPERAENSSDTIEMDLRLLLPPTHTSINFGKFVTQLPAFQQVLGNLSFEKITLEGSSAPITVGSISAASIIVRTSDAEISGNFSASDKIYLETVNAPVFANVLLHNNKNLKRHTRLSIETGNGPIVAQVKLAVNERVYFVTPRRRNFFTKFRTFHAPMNVSVAHVEGSKPARLAVTADNSQGLIDLSLDSLYTGTFEVRTKSATARVLESIRPDSHSANSSPFYTGTDGDGDGDKKHGLHFVYASPERARGWIGDDRRPEQFDRNSLSRVEVRNSLGPIRLHLPARPKQPSNGSSSIRR